MGALLNETFFLRSVQGRILAILIFFMTVSLLGSFFVTRTMSQRIISSEKANKLLLAASLLDFRLGERDYKDILVENGAENASREEQIAVLNRALSALGDSMTELYLDLGVGYYSPETDAGMDGHVSKPINIDEIYTALCKTLKS